MQSNLKIAPPPQPLLKRSNTKGEPPTSHDVTDNLRRPDSAIVPLNFRVPATFKKDFKIAAATTGITLSALLQYSFEEWRKKNG